MSATLDEPIAEEAELQPFDEQTAVVKRFSFWARATHAVLATSVFGLVLSGMPLRYPGTFWAKALFVVWSGADGAGAWHRVFAVGFMSAGAMHVLGVIAGIASGRFPKIFGPDGIMLRPTDVRHLAENLRYLRGHGPRPEFGRFTYLEKFDYFAEVWGLLVIGLSGLVMWFPARAAGVLPGWAVNAAVIFHSYEGLLAMGFLFSIHFFNTHLRPEVFPVDEVIFSGDLPLHEVRDRYPGWYSRLMAEGSGRVLPERGRSRRPAAIVSGAFLSVGLVMLVMVMLAALAEGARSVLDLLR
jgi:cytochrome b subunit of formate dehydrogenase